MHFRLALSGLLRLLENLLDNLLLLNQESTDNAVLDTSGAAGTTVGTADVLLGAGDLGVFTGTEGGNLKKYHRQRSAVSTRKEKRCYRADCAAFSSFSLPFVHHRFFQPRSPIPQNPHNPHARKSKTSLGGTYTRELDATVTALGSSALLLDVEVPELAAGGLDDADLVGPRVVPVEFPSISVSQKWCVSREN